MSVFLLIFLTVFSNEIFACSCSNSNTATPQDIFNASDAVFRGSVIDVDDSSDKDIYALFEVETSWKGVRQDKLIVRTDKTSCGINFKKGEKYLLWLDSSEGHDFKTVPCRIPVGDSGSFLQSRPELPLKSVLLDFPVPKKNGTVSDKDQTDSESSSFSRDLVLVVSASVVSVIFVLIIAGIAFFFWQRKR